VGVWERRAAPEPLDASTRHGDGRSRESGRSRQRLYSPRTQRDVGRKDGPAKEYSPSRVFPLFFLLINKSVIETIKGFNTHDVLWLFNTHTLLKKYSTPKQLNQDSYIA
jgi:hypothetical protein